MKFITTDKIFHHPDRLSAYKEGQTVIPINVELHLTNKCNLRCHYCFSKHRRDNTQISRDNGIAVVNKIKDLGIKSLIFSGGGEPTLHKDYLEIIAYAKEIGLDVALITNGVSTTRKVLEYLTWIRFSLDASNGYTYKKIKGADCFSKVLQNIIDCVSYKKKKKLKTTIGIQAVVVDENKNSIPSIAKLSQYLGADYFQYRPLERGNILDKPVLDKFDIEVIDSDHKWIELKEAGSYRDCPAADFIGAIGADLNYYICCHHVGDSSASYGNILTDDILAGRKRIQKNFDYSKCPVACRGSATNRRLMNFTKIEHVNFI